MRNAWRILMRLSTGIRFIPDRILDELNEGRVIDPRDIQMLCMLCKSMDARINEQAAMDAIDRINHNVGQKLADMEIVLHNIIRLLDDNQSKIY